MSGEKLVTAYHSGMVVSFARAGTHTRSSFGGPLEESVSRKRHGRRPLHLLARLAVDQLPIVGVHKYSTELPLIYGLSYSGCRIKYRVSGSSDVELLELKPSKSSEDFPYLNYPVILPFVPLKVVETRSCTYDSFAQQFANMPEEEPAELIVAIPPPATIGVSLWGRWGDAEGVTVVFECGLGDAVVCAYNVCT